ncbi:MAG: NYN domain-containing protein [Candidatus Moraniibacteriota bacterium]
MARFTEQRVGVLVDIQNLYYSARVLYGKKVNFKSVLEEGVGGRKLIRAIAYGIKTVEGMEEKFFEALNKSGYDVKTKDLQIFPDGSRKGDWDVGIAIDAIKMAEKLDALILVSGDGDYVPLVEYIQNTFGCRVEAMAFAESASAKLIEKVDDFTNLSDNKRRFLIG